MTIVAIAAGITLVDERRFLLVSELSAITGVESGGSVASTVGMGDDVKEFSMVENYNEFKNLLINPKLFSQLTQEMPITLNYHWKMVLCCWISDLLATVYLILAYLYSISYYTSVFLSEVAHCRNTVDVKMLSAFHRPVRPAVWVRCCYSSTSENDLRPPNQNCGLASYEFIALGYKLVAMSKAKAIWHSRSNG